MDTGKLLISVQSTLGIQPVSGAKITLRSTGDPTTILESFTTDSVGQSETIELKTPPLEYSMEPEQSQPYALYTIEVEAEAYAPVTINGIEVMPDETALQTVKMQPLADGGTEQNVVIDNNTLFEEYPSKMPEAEIKPTTGGGEIVLSRVVVPEIVVVHDGPPSDNTARNYYVPYAEYIKNVASSEIYATWPRETIKANVLAIMSFTLNRVYTEWYRNKSYDFTITSSTAYDHKWTYGRNIYQSISNVVDELLGMYLARPDVKQPILTQYCDGKMVSCPNWMTQWGSKYLGDQNYKAIDILRYYYGSNMYINEAEQIAGIPAAWPGYNLEVGAGGTKVKQMQEQLIAIAKAYPQIQVISADGIYGPKTEEAVKAFQRIFHLPVTGVVDYATWYKISQVYVGVTKIAELN
ncbi:Putative peptidoglycan-binding domain-containing protein [Lachnospiraceae bacterium XBB1006]|nr:Putative peptidoglycan-binding domain-containing protein [Lachnospiraceae bacterium XBB1006]